MFLHTITPQGSYTTIDLNALPVWRLELAVMSIPSVDPAKIATPESASLVALCLSYISAGTKARAVIAAVDTKSPPDAIGMVETGLPCRDLKKDRERLTESAKALYNNEDLRKEAEEIVPKVAKLADIYHAMLDAMGEVKASEGSFSRALGPKVKGTLEGWQFALTTDRFDPWRKAQDTLRGAQEETARFDAPPPPAQKEAYGSSAGEPAMELGGQPPAEGTPHPKSRLSKEKARALREKAAAVEKEPEAEPEVMGPETGEVFGAHKVT